MGEVVDGYKEFVKLAGKVETVYGFFNNTIMGMRSRTAFKFWKCWVS